MSVKYQQYPTGYLDPHCFERKAEDFFTYHSPIRQREYELHYVKIGKSFQWNCNCPDARYISHKQNKPCKHEKALAMLQWRHEKRQAEAEMEAESIIAEAQERSEKSEVEALRAEVAQVRAELAEISKAWKKADLMTADTLSKYVWKTNEHIDAMQAEIDALKTENEHMKQVIATKATARKKHQTETEAALIKEQINTALDDAMQQAENAILAAKMARAGLADLEAIPHSLKSELDSWTEGGKEELQPDFKPDDANAPEVKAQVREAQETARKRREATAEERRKMAPLNGNKDFSLWK